MAAQNDQRPPDESNTNAESQQQAPRHRRPFLWISILLAGFFVLMELRSSSGGQEIPYSRFLAYLEQKLLTTIELRGDHIAGFCVTDVAFEKGVTAESLRKSGEAKAGETPPQRSGEPSQIFLIRTAKIQDEDLISRLHEAEVEFGGVIPSTLSRLSPILIPLGIILPIFSNPIGPTS
ncbi:MAG: ATP-dependent metallopeptidase FtsH/Yme1/Tma family protein [Fuerstiella sp.]|nr:ATP-dependent metallopeptidase FtsH/Yme1/Tma family protein [Fuerstiella sp.]